MVLDFKLLKLETAVISEGDMAKVDEIKRAYEEFRQRSREYNDLCYSFAAQLRRGFAVYLGSPDDYVTFFPPRKPEEAAGSAEYTQAGAMELEADGFWLLGVAVHIPGVGIYTYVIRFKHVGEEFVLELGDGVEFEAENGESEELEAFYNHLVDITKSFYKKYLDDLLSGDRPEPPFGFIHS